MAVVTLLLVATAGVFYWFVPKSISLVANPKSVAVLPFDNISDIVRKISIDLRVISRQSVLRYRDVPIERQKGLSEVGRELNVAAILESSVQRIDNQVKIIAVLYDVHMNKRLWGASYDREMKDISAFATETATRFK